MSDAHELLTEMRAFNSKERYYVITHALGIDEFRLGKAFREAVRKCFDFDEDVPADAFVAMDFHFDWLYGCLSLAFEADPFPRRNDQDIIGNQEDADLLVAFRCDGGYRVIVVEAKGVTGWTNKQMKSKVRRLTRIFGANGSRWPEVRPYLALLGPRKPVHLDLSSWPMWARDSANPYWLTLPSIPQTLKSTVRVHIATNQPDKHGRHWRVRRRFPR